MTLLKYYASTYGRISLESPGIQLFDNLKKRRKIYEQSSIVSDNVPEQTHVT